MSQIVAAVKDTLDRTPPELAGDIMDRGITLAGGGALLQGMDERMREECQMPCQLTESPLTCVAVGSGRSLEEFEVIHRMSRTTGRRRRQARPSSRCTASRSRRRRAVLVALIVLSLILLSSHFSEAESGPLHSIQRGVSAVFAPVGEVAARALKPVRDLVNWFDETFDARGENEDLRDRGREAARPAGRLRGGRGRQRAVPQAARAARREPGRRRLRPGHRAGDRALADRLVLRRDDRRGLELGDRAQRRGDQRRRARRPDHRHDRRAPRRSS